MVIIIFNNMNKLIFILFFIVTILNVSAQSFLSDNLGNHKATKTLNMNNNSITNVSTNSIYFNDGSFSRVVAGHTLSGKDGVTNFDSRNILRIGDITFTNDNGDNQNIISESIVLSFRNKFIAEQANDDILNFSTGTNYYKMLFSNELDDVGGVYSNQTSRWYPKDTAMHRIIINVSSTNAYSQGITLSAYLYENGVRKYVIVEYTNGKTERGKLYGSIVFKPLTTNDYYEVYLGAVAGSVGGDITIANGEFKNQIFGEKIQ